MATKLQKDGVTFETSSAREVTRLKAQGYSEVKSGKAADKS